MATEQLHRLVGSLPYPIAVLAARTVQAEAGRDRHDAAFYLGEATLKLAAAARIGAWLKHVDVSETPDLARRLESIVLPSTGAWCGYLRDVGEALGGLTHPLAPLAKVITSHRKGGALERFADALVEDEVVRPATIKQARRRGSLGFFELMVVYRNEVLGHGAQRERTFYVRYGDLLTEALTDVLSTSGLWGELKLRMVRHAVEGREAKLQWVALTGLAPLPLERAPDACRAEHLYFSDGEHIVPLHPLVVATDTFTVGFLNKAPVRRGTVRRAEYLDYATGRTLEDIDAQPALASLLSKLRGTDVDVATVTSLASTVAPPPSENPPAQEPSVGTMLGHYALERELGRGGMGRVFGARDTKLDRRVALKVLTELDFEGARQIEHEARALAQLDHPHIVSVYAVESADERTFLTMEWIEGHSLQEAIGQGLDLEALTKWGRQIADAVAVAHEASILHRDLKPANVMVNTGGDAVVLDFGLAQLIDAPHREGALVGTPSYMAPEQAEGRALDERTDVFALGVTLYEMACGARPFGGDSTVSVLSSVLKDAPRPLPERRAGLPPSFVRLVERCLEKDPARRYQSVRDVALELEALASHPDAPAKRASPNWWLGAAGLALGVATGVVVQGGIAPSPGVSHSAELPSANTSAPPTPPPWRFRRVTHGAGAERDPYLAPDATWFVYAAEHDGALDVYRQRVGGDRPTNLTTGASTADDQPSISPDGQSIAFRSERNGGGIFVMGATGESVRRVTDRGFHPRWSPDGRALVLSSHQVLNPRSRGTVSQSFVVDVESGKKTELPSGRDAVQGTWSPNGTRLAFAGGLGPKREGLLTTTVGGPASLVFDRGDAVVWTPFWAKNGDLYFASNSGGAMNVWRMPVDEASGASTAPPQAVTAGVGMGADHPSVSSDGRRVLFRSTLTIGNIARIPLEGTTLTGPPERLTRGVNGFSSPDLSPNGAGVTFCSCWVRSDVDENIYVMDADGQNMRALTHDEGKRNRLPRWLSDDRIVFYSNRSGSWELWAIDRDGSDLAQLTHAPAHVMLFAIPRPADKRIATWLNMEGLAIHPVDQLAKATFDQAIRHPKPAHQFVPSDWSPDGATVLGSVGHEGSSVGIARLHPDERRFELLADHGEGPRYLADGQHIVFGHEGALELVVADGTQPPRPWLNIPGERLLEHVATSRDWLYVTIASEDGDLWLAERGVAP